MISIEEKRRKQRERAARWAAKNPEKAREVRNNASKRYAEKHSEKVRARQREYRANNKEARAKSWSGWYEINKEQRKAKDTERRGGSPEAKAKYLLQVAKSRAKKKNIEFSISISDVLIPTHCPLLGVELSYSGKGIHSGRSASLDRIDSNLGYVKGNVWIVSRRANVIKNDATASELRMIADNLEAKINRTNDE